MLSCTPSKFLSICINIDNTVIWNGNERKEPFLYRILYCISTVLTKHNCLTSLWFSCFPPHEVKMIESTANRILITFIDDQIAFTGPPCQRPGFKSKLLDQSFHDWLFPVCFFLCCSSLNVYKKKLNPSRLNICLSWDKTWMSVSCLHSFVCL